MSTEKPVHVPRDQYPEAMYPQVLTTAHNDHPSETGEVHLLDYWRIIIARRWVILAVLSTVVVSTFIYTFKQTPIYRATASIQIDRENPNILSFKDVYQIETSTDDTLRTQFEILRSRSLARRVIEDLSLDKSDEFAASAEPGLIGSLMNSVRDLLIPKAPVKTGEPDPLRRVIDAYLQRLQVTPVRQARLVTVGFESKDPELAARIINSHARHFISQNLQFKVEATQDASTFLEQNLGTLRATLEKSEDKLQAYSRENQILFTEEGKNTATEKLLQLESQYTAALGDRIDKESYDRLLRSGDTDALPQLVSNPLIADLTGKLADLERQESEISVTFRPDYPLRQRIAGQIAQIRTSIQSEKARVVTMIESQYSTAVERERLIANELEKQRDLVNKINQEIIYYNILKREVESTRKLHDGLLTRLKEAGISAGLTASNIRIVDRAEVPPWPVRPRKTLSLIISLIAGLGLGVGLAFFQHYMDDSIKNSDDVNRYLKVPVLGMVPKMGALAGRQGYGYGYGEYAAQPRLTKGSGPKEPVSENPATKLMEIDMISHYAPSSLMAEAYRSIRTSLLLSSPGHPPKSVLVTSALPSEGKTVTAVNTAISLTQTGARVALVDADMRKPRVHTAFGLSNAIGLSNFLTGSSALKDVLQPCAVPNLFVLPCGPTPPNPGELILSNRFRQVLQVLYEYFDYVVLDSPPISNVSDARILASACESTILVVKGFSTPRHHAVRSVEYLIESRAKIAGVVLNDLDVRGASGYYSYYIPYSYSGKSGPAA